MTDDIDIYRQQGFAGSTGFGRAPALLVVDFVNGFNDPGTFGGGNIPQAIAATRPLLAGFRERGFPIVFTRIVYADDGSDAGLFCRKAPRLLELTESAPASHVVPELAPLPGELVVRKRNASSFFGTDLAGLMLRQGVDTAVVVGCTTSGCVRATAVDAMSWGFRTVVVRDCVGDRAAGPHAASLFDLEQKYADVMDSEAVAARIATLAAA